MLFLLALAYAYKAQAIPISLGPDVFSSTPFTFLFSRSAPCSCGPQDRTLSDVIRGCVLTIFACVYTSLHPNIPNPNATRWQKILGRLKMSFYALIAPEAVIWWAMRQWYGARRVAKWVNSIRPDLNWTTTHGHYAQMGALVGVYPDGRREAINPGYIDDYIKAGWIDADDLRFEKDQIQDLSKGDFLSKGLAALQTSWFVLECVARFRQHLPITEVEVITLAYAVLNAITYGLWWNKPLNVNCQVTIYMNARYIPSQDSQHDQEVDYTPSTNTAIGLWQGLRRFPQWAWNTLIVNPFCALVLPIQDMFSCYQVDGGASHVPIFYGAANETRDLLRIRLITCFIGMIFGAIHLIPWDSHFPTHIELIFWRSSSIVIVVVPFLVGLFGLVVGQEYWAVTWDVDPSHAHARPDILTKIVAIVLYTLGPVLYILARISLIILAFLSLRDLPPGVFESVESVAWTSYIPHL